VVRAIAAGVSGIALLTGVTALASTARPATADAATVRKVSAWLPAWDTTRGYQSFLDNADLYADLSPFWYELSAGGTIVTYEGGENATVVSGAKAKGVAVIPTVTNNFDPGRVHTMLASAVGRSAHVQALVNLVVTKGYDGIDLDYESMQAADRSLFSAFIGEAAAALHQQNKQLSVTVHAKTSEPGTWDGPQAQDYAAIGAAADRVRLMAYDYHWETSPAGAIAPLPWVEQVAQFAASQIPPSKVQLGIGLYGYDWVGSQGAGLTFDQVAARLASTGATRQWSTADSAPWFRYSSGGVTHDVWYEDAQSVAPKLALVDKYGLAGAVFWRLGGEDAAVWTTARTRWGDTAPTADATAPTAPGNLTASKSSRRVKLSWRASTDTGGSGLAGYDVLQATSSTGPWTKIAATTSLTYTTGSLTAKKSYWFVIKARDGAGNLSTGSNTVKVTI
jgi:spore germination protein YaaH